MHWSINQKNYEESSSTTYLADSNVADNHLNQNIVIQVVTDKN
jgi:hypothetical protein